MKNLMNYIYGINYKDTKYFGVDSHRNSYLINYENSSSGVYRNVGKKSAMKAYMEDRVGDKDIATVLQKKHENIFKIIDK